MAPEQATGPAAAITTAVDVYALGAVLYEMLTHRPPFKGDSVFETLRLLVETTPVRPTILNPHVDYDLESICLKCLEKDPHQRYASARDLAADLERYLSGEPIQVRPATTGEWLLRWCRRDPVRAGLTAGLGVAVLCAMVLICLQWRLAVEHLREVEARNLLIQQQKDDLEARNLLIQQQKDAVEGQNLLIQRQKTDLEKHKATNERQAELAHRTIHDLCESFQGPKTAEGGPPHLRKELLQSAMQYYQEFLRVRGDDPAVKKGVALNYRLLGELGVAAGAKTETLEAFQREVALYEEVLRFQPDDLDVKLKLARSLESLSNAQISKGQPADAVAVYRRSEALCEELLRARPKDPAVLELFAGVLYNHAARLIDVGAAVEAPALLRRSQGLLEQWLLLEPGAKEPTKRLAGALNLIGVVQMQQKRPAELKEALVTFERSLALRQAAVNKPPQSPWDRRDVAETYFNVGVARRNLNQLEEAEASFVQSRDLLEQLKTELPNAPPLWRDLAGSYTALGALHAAAGEKDLAIGEYQQAVALQERVVADNPRQRRNRRDLARTSDHLARALAARGRDREALTVFQNGVELMEKLVAEDPDNLEFRFGLCGLLDDLGLFLGDRRQKPEEGAKYLRQAVTHGRFGLNRAPEAAGYRTNLGCYYRSLAHLEFAAGNTAAAATAAHEELSLFAGHGVDLFNVACDLARCAERVGKAPALSAEQKAERDRYAGWAAEALRAAAAAGFRDGDRVRKEPVFSVIQDQEDYRQALAAMDNAAARPR